MNSSQRVAVEIEGEAPPPDRYRAETYKDQLQNRKNTRKQIESTFSKRKENTQDDGRQALLNRHYERIQELKQIIKEGKGADSAPHDFDHDINRLIRGFQLDDDRTTITHKQSTSSLNPIQPPTSFADWHIHDEYGERARLNVMYKDAIAKSQEDDMTMDGIVAYVKDKYPDGLPPPLQTITPSDCTSYPHPQTGERTCISPIFSSINDPNHPMSGYQANIHAKPQILLEPRRTTRTIALPEQTFCRCVVCNDVINRQEQLSMVKPIEDASTRVRICIPCNCVCSKQCAYRFVDEAIRKFSIYLREMVHNQDRKPLDLTPGTDVTQSI